MTKIFQKTMVLLMLVMVMMTSLAMPAFADGNCSVAYKMYGDGKGEENWKAADGTTSFCANDNNDGKHPYKLDITIGDKVETVYLAARPDVNNVGAQINKDGKLEIFGMGNGDSNTWNNFFSRYKGVIVGISGVGAITFIALFIMQFMKLGASAGNPQARSQALTGCLWTGIAAAALGAVSIIAGFFYNAI